MNSKKSKIGRNDICPCGSGLKYKKCCMNKKENSKIEDKEFSIPEILSLLKTALQDLNIVNKEVSNITWRISWMWENRCSENSSG